MPRKPSSIPTAPSSRRRFSALGPSRHAAFLVAVSVLFSASLALARAGGGEHYVDRTVGLGEGAEGSEVGAWIVFALLRAAAELTFFFPGFMIPFWLLVGAGLFVIGLRRRKRQEAPLRLANSPEKAWRRLSVHKDLPQQLAQLKERDPDFDPERFIQRSRKVFTGVQEAWFLRDFSPVRHLMSDGVHRRFRVLQALMRKEGRRDALADLKVRRIQIVRAQRSESFDAITVGIEASIRDTEVEADLGDAEAREAALKAPESRFVEAWTFVRRPGARSRPGFDAAFGQCPNCGAPPGKGATSNCEYCGAIVNSGQYDWVLSEITQPETFRTHQPSTQILAPLLERDSDAAVEILQDRALLLFWKWLDAWGMEDLRRLKKVSSAEFFSRQQQEKAGFDSKGQRLVIRLPAVGGVDLHSLELDSGGMDQLTFIIRWSAAVSMEENGQEGAATPRYRQHVLTMHRQSGVKSGNEGLSTERCGTCRAPLSDSDSFICEFCGHDLSSASSEWQMIQLLPHAEWQRLQEKRRRAANEKAEKKKEEARRKALQQEQAGADERRREEG